MTENQNPMPKPELKNVPPPQDLGGGGDGAFFAPALRTDAEQFPVLKAFQTYIEEERERARRRVVIVSASAIAAIVVIVVVFLVIGSIVVGNLMSRNDQLLAAVISSAAPGAAQTVQTPAQESAVSAEPSPEVAALNAKIAELEKSNSALSKQMEGLQSLPDQLAGRMDAVFSNAMTLAAGNAGRPADDPAPAAVPTVRVSQTKKPEAPAAPLPESAATTAEVTEVVQDPTEAAATPVAPVSAPEPVVEVVKVKTVANAKPMIDGYRGENVMLTTDSGVRIPWRIAVEK